MKYKLNITALILQILTVPEVTADATFDAIFPAPCSAILDAILAAMGWLCAAFASACGTWTLGISAARAFEASATSALRHQLQRPWQFRLQLLLEHQELILGLHL